MPIIPTLQPEPYEAWRQAEELFSGRDYLGAARILEELLLTAEDGRTGLSQVRELLARAYYHSARLGPAAQTARALLLDEPTNGYVALLLSRTLERSNDPEGAARYRQHAAALGVEG